jgi:2-polyprenyl-3-methyl-5-hydroxy-6-metoxy-1,4-benzoquinol methylase
MIEFNTQFTLEKNHYLNNLDFKDWIRYYEILKDLLHFNIQNVLEIGPGSSILKNILKANVSNYTDMDINQNLNPDIVNDVQNYLTQLCDKYDSIIACEVLEHIDYPSVKLTLRNLYLYLKNNGYVFITIPHIRPFIAISSLLNINPRYLLIPKFRNKRLTDPYHKWEIGRNNITIDMVQQMFIAAGFTIVSHKNIPYHSYWVLKKSVS